jgi:hypothetical protein
MIRKTILMESEEPERDAEAEPDQPTGATTIPAGISAKTLRDLADLEERRQRGEIGEYDYEQQRNKILAADPATRSN